MSRSRNRKSLIILVASKIRGWRITFATKKLMGCRLPAANSRKLLKD